MHKSQCNRAYSNFESDPPARDARQISYFSTNDLTANSRGRKHATHNSILNLSEARKIDEDKN